MVRNGHGQFMLVNIEVDPTMRFFRCHGLGSEPGKSLCLGPVWQVSAVLRSFDSSPGVAIAGDQGLSDDSACYSVGPLPIGTMTFLGFPSHVWDMVSVWCFGKTSRVDRGGFPQLFRSCGNHIDKSSGFDEVENLVRIAAINRYDPLQKINFQNGWPLS